MLAFFDALAFLTRLGSARPLEASAFARCVPFFAPVGVVLGLLCTVAALLVETFMSSLPAFEKSATLAFALAALVWLGLEIWLTRGLHWDGLADLADAAGAPDPRFWEILKDSRLGVFGSLTLLTAFCSHWFAVAWHIAAYGWVYLLLAPAWGRICAIWLTASTHPYKPQSLGSLMKSGVNFKIFACHMLLALGITLALGMFGLSWLRCLTLLAVQYGLIGALARLAYKKGGFSGDFLGAAIVSGQIWFLLATL